MATETQSGEVFHCPLCVGTIFRRSRLTWSDIPRLLYLEIPIRCQECGERANVVFPRAMKAVAASANRRAKINQQDQ